MFTTTLYEPFRKMYTIRKMYRLKSLARALACAGEKPYNVHLTNIRFKSVRCTCTPYEAKNRKMYAFRKMYTRRVYAYARALITLSSRARAKS